MRKKIPAAVGVAGLAALAGKRFVGRGNESEAESGEPVEPKTRQTRDALYAEAKRLEIHGRSQMNKTALERAIAEARARGAG